MTNMATFGAGCFWGVEAAFRRIDGVVETQVGYAGGRTENPSYQQVCYEGTGHAEVVQVTYDPTKVVYEQLLAVFFAEHDPTQVNRQGPDVGEQYRSVAFYHSPEQKDVIEKVIKELARNYFPNTIATAVEPGVVPPGPGTIRLGGLVFVS